MAISIYEMDKSNNPQYIHDIGMCYELLNNTKLAIEYYEKTLKMGFKNAYNTVIKYYKTDREFKNIDKVIYYANFFNDTKELISQIKELLTSKDGDVDEFIIDIISNLSEEDLKDEPHYLKLVSRNLRHSAEEIYTHFKLEVGGSEYEKCKKEWTSEVVKHGYDLNYLTKIFNDIDYEITCLILYCNYVYN